LARPRRTILRLGAAHRFPSRVWGRRRRTNRAAANCERKDLVGDGAACRKSDAEPTAGRWTAPGQGVEAEIFGLPRGMQRRRAARKKSGCGRGSHCRFDRVARAGRRSPCSPPPPVDDLADTEGGRGWQREIERRPRRSVAPARFGGPPPPASLSRRHAAAGTGRRVDPGASKRSASVTVRAGGRRRP